jgi:hypothetical protein
MSEAQRLERPQNLTFYRADSSRLRRDENDVQDLDELLNRAQVKQPKIKLLKR